jgi:hypothetical protein
MSLPFADPYENMTPQRLQELLQRERYERDAARRRLFAGIAFYVRVAFERCRDLKSSSLLEKCRTGMAKSFSNRLFMR